jgi:hypothetical protein
MLVLDLESELCKHRHGTALAALKIAGRRWPVANSFDVPRIALCG